MEGEGNPYGSVFQYRLLLPRALTLDLLSSTPARLLLLPEMLTPPWMAISSGLCFMNTSGVSISRFSLTTVEYGCYMLVFIEHQVDTILTTPAMNPGLVGSSGLFQE